MTQYGMTPQGYVPKQQSTIIAEIYASLQGEFGVNINVAANSIFSQFVGIFAGREALLWQLGEAVYVSQYPTGAEGTSVDNILALSNLKRLGATATVTNPDPVIGPGGVTQFGLLLFGTPGTPIPKGALVQTTAQPPLQLTLDNSVTIAAAVNAKQQISLSAIPTGGTFQLTLVDNDNNVVDENDRVIQYAGNTLTTPSISGTWLSQAISDLQFSTTPTASSSFKIALTACGITLTTAAILTNSAYPTASAVQSAITALTGYSAVSVLNPNTGDFVIGFANNLPTPVVSIVDNTTGATITLQQALQSYVNNLHDASSTANPYPFSDVELFPTNGGQTLNVNYGATGFPISGSLPSTAQPFQLVHVVASSLVNGMTAVTSQALNVATGAPAQAVASATANVTGPNSALAGTITDIGSPVSGWAGVTNQLDGLVGSNTEDDTQALLRRSALLSANANGPLQSIIQRVRETVSSPPITAVLGFQNLTGAALQALDFTGGVTPGGHFQLNINGVVTANITINGDDGDAGNIQTGIRALTGYSGALVIGEVVDGFSINWNGSQGGQPIPLVGILANTTGATITPSFGRPGHSVEIVVDGGSITDIATSIFKSIPGGIQPYGRPFNAIGDTSTSVNPTIITSIADTSGIEIGMLATAPGIPPNTFVLAVTASTVTISQPVTATASDVALVFTYTAVIDDIYGNPYVINFSRPQQVPIFVTLALVTDIYNTPGDSGSGFNQNTQFQVGSISTIIADLLAIGNATPIGGRVIGFGTNGLVGAFNAVPGIVGYTLNFGKAPSPSGNDYIQLLPEQRALFESLDIAVSYS